MSKIDDLINESLNEEDKALLKNYEAEPGWFKQAFALFRGSLAWVMWMLMIVQILMFLLALYALWVLFTTPDLITAVRWGAVAIIMFQLHTFLRGFMGSHLEANRVLRGIARLELRLVRMEKADSRNP